MKALSLSVLVTLIATTLAFQCKDERVINTTTVGAAGEVTVELVACNMTEAYDLTSKRQNDVVCFSSCNTNCFNPAGGGPDPYDCLVIADTMKKSDQIDASLLPVGAAFRWVYGTCASTIMNQSGNVLLYCNEFWAEVTTALAFGCQALQNAHGGNCVPNDQNWYIQVQPSVP